METKVVIDVVCIHCGCKIQLQKKVNQTQCKLICPSPACKRSLHILFDVEKDPQTYTFFSANQQNSSSKSTKENVDDVPPISEAEKKAKKDKTIYKKDKKKAHSYDSIPGEDDEDIDKKAKKRPKLKESLFLTRKKFLGLVAERYKLSEGQTIIGRDDDEDPSDISITGDETISRRSISINIVPDEYGFDYILKVINASNPVRVNGKQVRVGEKVYLDLGDIITIGHTNLKFDNQ